MAPRILVVEDEPAIAELISVNLEHDGYEVKVVADARSARWQIDAVLPDLVLLDWMLPDQSGVALARELRQHPRTRALPIIVLTARSTEADKVSGLESGADDYVTKPFSPRELAARIRAVLRRRSPQSTSDPVQIGSLHLDPVTYRVTAGGAQIKLGPTEFKLLHYLMSHPEWVHSRQRLLDQVWGDHVYVEERTVDVHIRRLRQALEASGSDRYIQTVRGGGYRCSAQVEGGDG